MTILVSTIYAVKYFDSSEIFDAEILQINQNGKFSVDLQIKNKINENLNFEIEVIYRQGNLVVSTDYLDCKTNCQINLEIDKIFFDKYTIQIRTFSAGRGYEKNLHFKYEKQEPTFKVTVPQEIYWDYKDLKIPIEFKSKNKNEISNYILDIYPTKRPEIKSTYTFQCMGTCIEEFIISKSILFGEYSINVYSNIDVLKLYFNVIPTNITKSQQQANGNITKSNLTQEQIKTIPELEFNQTINQSSNKTKDTSLEEILGYTKIEYNKYDLEESEEVESCIIYENLDEELKQERKKQISTALCKFDYKLNEVSENFEIKKIPSSIEMGDEFEFEITIPVGTNLNNSNFNLPEGFEIVAQKNFNLSENMPSKINALNSKFNSKLNQVTTQVAKSYLVKGTVTSLDDTVQIFENKGWLKKDLELNIKKSEELIEFEKVIKVNVDKIKNNISSGKSDLSLQKETSRIEFENIDLGSIDKVEVITKYELINYVPEVRNNLKTDIVNVIAKNFKNAKVILEKKQSGEITKILACEYFGENECLTGWEDSKYDIFQNETHVWFNTIHFSAYSGVGSGYIFDVDFESYAVTKIFQNNVENINVTVSCTMAGNCGTINVSLYTTGTPVNNFVDFESGFGSWSDTSESWCKWKLTSGKTPSRNTGPGGNIAGFDHTLGTSVGSFIFTESSNDWCRFRTATLTGTSFTVGSVESKISFWYHMAADNSPSHMGTLHFDVYDGSSWVNDVWSLSGVQQGSNDPFLFAEIDLSIFSGLINTRFRMSGVTVLSSWQGDLALDDIRIDSFGVPLTTLSSPPFKIDGIAQKQVSLLQGETKNVVFRVNATGLQGDIAEIYSLGISSVDSLVKSLSNMKILTLPETVPPSGSKISPADTSTSVTKTVTFTSSVTDNSALSKATINIWNSNGNLVGSETKDVSETSDTATFDFSFTTEGAYTWNIFVEDISGNTAWLGINWSINLDFPGLGLNFINLPDNFQIIKDTTKNITVDISCTNANCGLTNVSLNTYFYSPPLFDDFESSIETIWTNVGGDDSNWWLEQTDNHKYGTRSTETGPSVDHTTGTGLGWLMYLETSDGYLEQNEFAYLESSTFTSSSAIIINFWYHMYASDNPTLTLEYHNGILWTEIWTTTGNLGDNWLNQEIELNYVGELKFRFTGTDNKNSYLADIALDDILITPKQYYFIDNISTTPAYVIGPSIQQVTLTDGTSATLTFELNATGFVGEEHYVIVRGQSNLDSNLDGQSQSKHLDIVDYFEVNVSQININPIIQTAGDSILITCKVENGFTGEAIDNYQVIFSSSRTGTIGTSYTDNLGFVYLNYTIPKTPTVSNIYEDIICTIGNDVSKKYYALSQNFLSTQLNVTESAPWYTHWSITNGNAQDWTRKDIVRLSAIWKDNFNLSHMELEHNGAKPYEQPNPNLILDLDFETVSNPIVFDNSNSNNDGTISTGVTVNNLNPIHGDYLSFDGTGSISVPYSPELNIGDTGGSVFLWFKLGPDPSILFPTNTYTRGLIFNRGHNNPSAGPPLGMSVYRASHSISGIFLDMKIGSFGISTTKLTSTTPLSVETWYHTGVVWNTTHVTLYLNGKPDLTMVKNYPVVYTNNHPFYIGEAVTTGGTGSGDFIGDIDEVKVYNYTLTDIEIKNLYNPKFGPYTNYSKDFTNFSGPNLILDIDSETVSGSTIYDNSINSYDGTLGSGIVVNNSNPILGDYLTLDGTSSSFVTIPYYEELEISDSGGSVFMWFKMDSDLATSFPSNTYSRGLIYLRGHSNKQVGSILGLGIFKWSSLDRLSLHAGLSGSGKLETTTYLSAETWYQAGIVWNSTDYSIYLNSKKIGTKSRLGNITLFGNYPLYFGHMVTIQGTAKGNFIGDIDEMKLFNYTLSDTEIYNLYNSNIYHLDFTNFTQFPNVGPIRFNAMYGVDNFDWATKTSPSYDLNLYGFADISQILPIPAAVGAWGESSTVYCEIKDNDTGIPIQNYPVSFNSDLSGPLGTNTTDILGRAYMTDIITADTTFSCSIADEQGLYYYANKNYDSVLISRDQIAPTYSNWGFKYLGGGDIADGTNINNTELVYVHSLWQDNYQLYTGYLTHSGSGTNNNYSINSFPTILDSIYSWANQTLEFTNSTQFSQVGRIDLLGMTISDKADNTDTTTPSKYFYLYGFANASKITVSESIYGPNTTIIISCKITDSTHKGPIENYNVNIISNETGLISTIQTNSSGIASTTYTDTTPGQETISCNIIGDTYYYVNQSSISTQVFYDNSIPSIISGYGLSSNIFHPSESVTLSALWSESINSSEIYTDEENFVVSSYTNNVTLGTITSTLSWAKGPHDVSFVNTIDQNNNINYSVQNLTLDLYHYADIVDTNLLSSSTDVNSTMYYGCRVQDMDTNNYIDGYEVRYYEDGVFVGSDLTDTDGWSYSSHIPNTTGTKTIKCKILLDSVNYYDPTIPSYETFSSNVSSLSGRVCETDILSVSYNNYFDTALEDGFILTGTNCVSGSNNNFVSWLNQVSGTADSDSGVSSDYKIFHSNGVLDIGPELQLGCINGNNRQDSYTHLYKDINPASLIGFKILFYYTDRSGGNGLELDSSPNNVVSFSYNSNQNSVNSTTYISETFTPIISTCSGEDNTGLGATAYYQEVDEYGLIQSMIDEGLSSIDLRLALYANSNYDGGNDLARWHYNEFELYTKQLSVVMLTPISTIESYENKSESLTCVVQTSGTNTSNVDLYPQFCSGDSCTSFTNIQSNSGAIRVNESSYACTDSHCSKTFNINYSEEGTYNLRCSSTNFDSYTVASTSEQLTVYNSDLIISDISHDQNNNSEFEIGDKINHINVSIKNSIRGKSYSPSVEINLINSSSQTPVWSTQFPQIGYCSNPMLQNTTCNLTFKNSDNGFIIDTSAKEGIYNISTTLLWENSGNIIQSNKSIKIFNLNNRFTSVVDNPSIIEGTSTIIRVNFTNPTSNNLTNLQLTLNCPVGFNCTNSNTHLVVLPNQTIISNFTISSTLSTPITSHNFTFDVTYNNIRGFSKSWSNITSTSILVKSDIFVVTLRHYKINKTITSLSQNNYSVNLQVINLQNFNQSISLIDFVDSQSKTSNFNFPINSSKIILGPKFNGTINIWNFTLTNFQSININYTLTINSTYSNMLNNYIIGLS